MAHHLYVNNCVPYVVEDCDGVPPPGCVAVMVVGYLKTKEPIPPPPPDKVLKPGDKVGVAPRQLQPCPTALVYGDTQRWVNSNAYLWWVYSRPDMETAWADLGRALQPVASHDGKKPRE